MSLLVSITIMFAWCSFLNDPTQTPAVSEKQSLLEKRAVIDTQRMFASELDAELPKLSFAEWFGKIVGPKAGVIWQLSECGEQPDALSNSAGEMRACAEANAILPDNRKVVVMVTVGTFKKGMTGVPTFYYGVIEHQEELYLVRRLRDLPGLLQTPGNLLKKLAVRLPAVEMSKVKVVNDPDLARSPLWSGRAFSQPMAPMVMDAAPPPPQAKPQPSMAPIPAENQKASEKPGLAAASETSKRLGVVSWGDAITKVQPRYPANAKRVNASGPVDVQITISEAGRVTEAKAINGHPLLRDAAVEAARQWIFKPAVLNGDRMETQIVLTFVFRAPQ